jgi:hypothetical protein
MPDVRHEVGELGIPDLLAVDRRRAVLIIEESDALDTISPTIKAAASSGVI